MHATSYKDNNQAYTGTLSVLEPYEAEEGKSSEATRLPVTWRQPRSWRPLLRPKTTPRVVAAPSRSKPPGPLVHAESSLAFDEITAGDLDDYLVCLRIEKAKNLLLNPDYYFSEIATELGFESLGQFNQAFKRLVGESPRAYRAGLPVGSYGAAQEA